MRAMPERLRDLSCGGAIQIDYLYFFYIYKSLFTIQYGRNDNEKIKNKKTFTANYYTL